MKGPSPLRAAPDQETDWKKVAEDDMTLRFVPSLGLPES